jgi:hypothetical protein
MTSRFCHIFLLAIISFWDTSKRNGAPLDYGQSLTDFSDRRKYGKASTGKLVNRFGRCKI